MLHFVLWKWDGWRAVYTHEHVNAAVKMIKAHTTIPHKIVCITDDPAGIKCRTIPLIQHPPGFNPLGRLDCYRRAWLFSPELQRALRMKPRDVAISLDLDMVIMRNADLLWLNMHRHKACFLAGRHSPFNGSLWSVRKGCYADVWDDYDPMTTPTLVQRLRKEHGWVGSDQAYFSHMLKGRAHSLAGSKHGVMQYMSQKSTKGCVVAFFAGGVKPWTKSVATHAPRLQDQYLRYLGDTTP